MWLLYTSILDEILRSLRQELDFPTDNDPKNKSKAKTVWVQINQVTLQVALSGHHGNLSVTESRLEPNRNC